MPGFGDFESGSSPTTALPRISATASAPTGGSGFGSFEGGGAPAPAPTPAATPAPAPKPKLSKGGKGLTGLFSHAFHDVASVPMGAVKGVSQIGRDVGVGIARGAELAGNEALRPFGAGHENQFHLGGITTTPGTGASGGSVLNKIGAGFKDYPGLTGAGKGLAATGEHVVGALELPALGVNKALGRENAPLTGLAKKTASDYYNHPVGALLNDAANVALVTGLVPEGVSPATDAIHAASKAIAEAPFRALGGAAGVAGEALSKTDAGARAVDYLRQGIEAGKAKAAVSLEFAKGKVLGADYAREANALTKAAGTPTADEYAAGLLRTQGNEPLLAALQRSQAAAPILESRLATMAPGGELTPEAARLAVNPTPAVLAAEAAQRGVSDISTASGVQGYGARPGDLPLNPEQVLTGPMPTAIDKLTGGADRVAAEEAGHIAPGQSLTDALTEAKDEAARARRLQKSEELQAGTEAAKGQGAAGEAVSRTGRTAVGGGAATGARLEGVGFLRRTGEASQETLGAVARAEDRVAALQALKDSGALDTREAAAVHINSLPSAIRVSIQNAQETVSELQDAINQAQAAGATGEAAELAQVLREIQPMTDTRYWEGSPNAPAHVPGIPGEPGAIQRLQQTGPRGVFRKLKTARFREGLSTTYTPEGQAALRAAESTKAAFNEGLKYVDAEHSVLPKEKLGDATGLNGAEIWRGMQADGPMRAWNPNATTAQQVEVPVNQITPNTKFLPEPIFDAITRRFPTAGPENAVAGAVRGFGTIYDKMSTAVRAPIHLSPLYAARWVVGDALVAAAHGVSPLDFISRANEARQMIANGEDPAVLAHLPSDVASTGGLSRITSKVPMAIDHLARTMVYIQKMNDIEAAGGTVDEAARIQAAAEADKAMGALTTMSPGERSIVQRMVPVYPWAKTVALALGKLSADNPQATLFAMHLGQLASQNKWNPGEVATSYNPFDVLQLSGGFINPLIRAAVTGSSGINLSTGKEAALPPNQKKTGWWLPGQDMAYSAANQLPLGKIFLQSPLSGLDQNISRYSTGQPFLKNGRTEKPLLPPIGPFGAYYRQLLGFPASPAKQATSPKTAATNKRTANKYSTRVAALARKGVR